MNQEVIDVDKDDHVEQKELLDDMGVNILSDNSNSCDTHQLKNMVKPEVLQVKSTNVMNKKAISEGRFTNTNLKTVICANTVN